MAVHLVHRLGRAARKLPNFKTQWSKLVLYRPNLKNWVHYKNCIQIFLKSTSACLVDQVICTKKNWMDFSRSSSFLWKILHTIPTRNWQLFLHTLGLGQITFRTTYKIFHTRLKCWKKLVNFCSAGTSETWSIISDACNWSAISHRRLWMATMHTEIHPTKMYYAYIIWTWRAP